MNTSSRSFFRFSPVFRLACFALFLFAFATTPAKAKSQAKVYPEIVRISYMQGDVRFSRGDGKKPDLTKPWEQAVPNLPILTGYSLATGDGRAEIEFEYGSTLYLAENSVLLFQTLTTTDGVPATEMELVTGTATVAFLPIPKEVFLLRTPMEVAVFSTTSISRVDSYLDGAAVTNFVDGQAGPTQWHSVSEDPLQATGGLPRGVPGPPADWNSWVAARVKQRAEDTAAALKGSGLPSFVPGLTDLYRGGTFFPCPPYGTCWEPNPMTEPAPAAPPSDAAPPSAALQTPSTSPQPSAAPASPAPAGNANAIGGTFQLAAFRVGPQQTDAPQSRSPAAQPQPQGQMPAPVTPATPGATTAPGQTPAPATTPSNTPPPKKPKPMFSDYYYPAGMCDSYEVHVRTVQDPVTGKKYVVQETYRWPGGEPGWLWPWPWALCHSGAWVHLPGRSTQYTFVAGRKRHHPPVRWMRTRHGDVYVPRHPSDVKGKPPLNLKFGVFKATNGPGGPFKRVEYDPKERYVVLKEAPVEFRNLPYPTLVSAARPEIFGREAFGGHAGTPVAFDYKTRNFVRPGAPIVGQPGRPVVVGRLDVHGGYSGRNFGGGAGGNGGYSGGGTGGGGSRGGGGGGGRGGSGGSGGNPPRGGGGGSPRGGGGGGGGTPRGGGGGGGGGTPRGGGGGGGGTPRGGGGGGGGGYGGGGGGAPRGGGGGGNSGGGGGGNGGGGGSAHPGH